MKTFAKLLLSCSDSDNSEQISSKPNGQEEEKKKNKQAACEERRDEGTLMCLRGEGPALLEVIPVDYRARVQRSEVPGNLPP